MCRKQDKGSSVCDVRYVVAGLNIKTQVTSATYRESVNKYGVKCGADLDMWESKGWISPIDPYGWFMW